MLQADSQIKEKVKEKSEKISVIGRSPVTHQTVCEQLSYFFLFSLFFLILLQPLPNALPQSRLRKCC